MTHKKQRRLTLGMAALFLFMFVFFGYLIITNNGNPIKESVVKRKIEAYQNEMFPLVIGEFNKSEITFNEKERSYQVTYTNKTNQDLSFKIIYDKKEKLTDNYQENITYGKELLTKLENKMQKQLENELKETYSSYEVKINKTLDQLEEKEEILKGTDYKALNIYELKVIKEEDEVTLETYVQELINLYNETKKITDKGFISYSIILVNKENEKDKIELTPITKELIEQGKDKVKDYLKESMKETKTD